MLASFLLKIIKQQRSKRAFTYTALDISYENRLSLFHYRACLSGYHSHCSDVPVTFPTIAIKSTQIKALLENPLILCLWLRFSVITGKKIIQKEYRLVNADTVRLHRNSPQSAGVELLIIACFSLENLKLSYRARRLACLDTGQQM